MGFVCEPYRVLRNLYLLKIACGRALAYVRACVRACWGVGVGAGAACGRAWVSKACVRGRDGVG